MPDETEHEFNDKEKRERLTQLRVLSNASELCPSKKHANCTSVMSMTVANPAVKKAARLNQPNSKIMEDNFDNPNFDQIGEELTENKVIPHEQYIKSPPQSSLSVTHNQ